MKSLLANLALTVLLPGPALAADAAGERRFGLTNLWTIRLTLSKADWKVMEPVERGGAFARPQSEARLDHPPEAVVGELNRGPRLPEPGAFDRDYPWVTCTFEGTDQVFTNVAIRFKGNSSFMVSRGISTRRLADIRWPGAGPLRRNSACCVRRPIPTA